jgi:hypothetical protein
MDIPSLFMIPSAVSSGKVHSVFPNSTDADFDFNRDSSATRVNSQGLIETVGYFSNEKVSSIENSTFPFNTFTDNGGGSYTCISTNTTFAGFRQPASERFAVTSGQVYRVSFDYVLNSGSTFQFFIGDDAVGSSFSGSPITISASGSYSFDLTIATTNSEARFVSQTNQIVNFTISNISVKEIQGDRARLNYEIEGGLVNTKPSLLLEPQSTNLITYSEDFSAYTTNNSSVSSNIVSSPDGSLSASKLIENTSTAEHTIQKAISVTSGNAYSISVFVKKEEISSVQFGFTGSNFAIPTRSIFDIENGTITTNVSNTASIESYGNGWYRLKVTNTANSTGTGMLILQTIKSGQANYAGDGVSGFYMWGLQWEQLSYSTSYIPTNGSTQTRAAETCNGAGTSSIFESSEGILYAEIQGLSNTGTVRLSISDGTNNNNTYIELSTNLVVSVGRVSAVNQYALSSSQTITNFNKIAIRYKVNDIALWVNGTQVATDTSANTYTSGTLSQINFDRGDGGTDFYGKIRDIRVYNTKEMTDSEVDILLTKITS